MPERPRSLWPPVPRRRVPLHRLPRQPEPSKVKVLHVITRFIAGSGGNTLASAAGMDPDRYEVWVAAMPGGPLWAEAQAAGVRTVEIPHMKETIAPWHDLRACWQLVRLIRRERFAVVHTHCSKAGLIGRVAGRLAGAPVVVHTFHILAAHDGLSPWRRRAYLFLERRVRSYAHRYVAVAPRLAREAVEQRVAPPGRVVVVPSAVDLESIPAHADRGTRADLGIDDDAEVVGTVGRIVAQKAPLDFVRMCALVSRVRPDVVFVMVGDTTLESSGLEEETRLEAQRLGVRILFTGFRADAPRVAATFDVYVVPSRYEGLGRALTEAMASGRPVVASAVNGVPDLVEPGVTGLLAVAGDVDAMADSVLWLLDHPEEAAMMGEQGRDRVRSHFATATMCHGLDELYTELLGLPAPPREPEAADAAVGAPMDLVRRTA
jgi:glycosyltransferase involved in cell wall biosynthesis